MAHPTPGSRPLLILYVAATETDARDGANALEAVREGPERTVHPTASVDRVREWTPEVDCVVYAEPNEPDDSSLLEVVEACGSTPLVLYGDGPSASRSSAGIDGYVRRETADGPLHLADEISWRCGGDTDRPTEPPLGDRGGDTGTAILETAAAIATCRERDRLFDRLVDGTVDVLGFECCWVATINFGELQPRAVSSAVPDEQLGSTPLDDPLSAAFRARQSIRIADLADLEVVEPPFEHVRSLCCVPVGDVGVLYVASELPGAFDATDLEVLEGLCETAASILERNWTETGISNDRDRLQRERDRIVAQYNRLVNDRNRLEADRNDLVSVVASLSEPTIRYELEDGLPVVADINDPHEAVFGDAAEAVANVPVAEYAIPSGLVEERTSLLEAIHSNEQYRLPCRRGTVDGVRDFVLTVVPLETDDADEPSDGLLVYEDVTESRRRKRELAAVSDRLETIAELVEDESRTPLNAARGYLELAEKTGSREHFEMVEDAHDRLSEFLEALTDVAGTDLETEPVGIREMAHRAWIGADTADAKLVTEDDLLVAADRERMRELFECVLQAAIEIEHANTPSWVNADAAGPVTVTVGATDDGFYVAGHRPASDDEHGRTDPDAELLVDADGTGVQLETVERIADAHGWDLGVAEDEDGTAFAFRGVDAIDS
ncbi:GAF domain-containing sensor histidine kinase [Natrarchaeobius sp. A-rgal3]|uniref:sensor histidine kinase n=1 Tax=Natrarchaeobius versutus TaxID=1679078 RepID=UPI00350FDE41